MNYLFLANFLRSYGVELYIFACEDALIGFFKQKISGPTLRPTPYLDCNLSIYIDTKQNKQLNAHTDKVCLENALSIKNGMPPLRDPFLPG